MNLRLKYVLSLLCLALAMPLAGFATEKDPKNSETNHQEQELKEDSLVIYDDENKVSDPFIMEDQLSISQPQRKPAEKSGSYSATPADNPEVKEEDSNSAMSFNFIYYIIDKFKLADPLD